MTEHNTCTVSVSNLGTNWKRTSGDEKLVYKWGSSSFINKENVLLSADSNITSSVVRLKHKVTYTFLAERTPKSF